MKKYTWLVLLTIVGIAVLIAGCDAEQKKDAAASSSSAVVQKEAQKQPAETKDTKTPAEENVKIYFPNPDGTKLVAANRKVKTGTDKYKNIVLALMEGPADKKEGNLFPKNTKLQSVKVEKGIAYLDFSKELTKNFSGGSTGELMLVGSLVDTLTEFNEIKGIQILVEGKKIDTISGHLDLSDPVKRMKDLLK